MAVLVAALLLGSCTSPGGGLPTLEVAGASVPVPAGWAAMRAEPADWPGGRTVALLSNATLDPACGEAGGARSCTAPAKSLHAGQLLVWWLSTTCAGAGCDLPDAPRQLVGGREAALVDDIDTCDALEPSGQRAYLVSVGPQRVDALVVCEDDPSDGTLADLETMLQGIHWRTP